MAAICMIAYTFYASDPRVRREAEALVARGDTVDFICLKEENSEQRNLEGIEKKRGFFFVPPGEEH